MRIKKASPESGSALLVSFATCVVIGIAIAAYLEMCSNEVQLTARSASWNMAISVAEAGIEEGLTHLHNQGTDNLESNGWSTYGSAGYSKSTTLNDDAYYEVTIGSGSAPSVTSTGYFLHPNAEDYISRTIQVTTDSGGLFMKGLVAKGEIDMNGNNIETDSFDSSDPSYSTDGQYDASKRKDNGDVATNLDLVNSISVGNANIRGRISTGPGGTVSVGSNGAVGSAAWHDGGNSGVESGYFTDDMNVSFPDVSAPWTVPQLPPLSGKVGGTNYNYVLSGGDYELSSLSMSGKKAMIVTGDSRLYVSSSFSMSGKSKILVDPSAKLELYIGGSSASLGGNGIINVNNATNVFVYGLPSLTSMSMSGNGEFIGVIYAPNADLSLNGGGSGDNDFIGAGVFNTVTMNGHFKFHYDEFLGTLDGGGDFTITSWNEL